VGQQESGPVVVVGASVMIADVAAEGLCERTRAKGSNASARDLATMVDVREKGVA